MQKSRRSVRLENFDYTSSAAYFVTLCSFERQHSFAQIVDGQSVHTQTGKLIEQCLLEIPQHFQHVEVGESVIMPNHIHTILTFNPRRGLPLQTLPPQSPSFGQRIPDSLGSIIGQFKSIVTKNVRASIQNPEARVWQRNYHDRIIRNDRELNAVREYIAFNPHNWSSDLEAQSEPLWDVAA